MHFSPRKTLKYFAEQNIISKDNEGKHSIVKYNDTKRGRFVEFDLTRAIDILSKDDSDKPDDDAFEGFTEIDDDSDLPF